jgi:hypothetical protein
MKAMPARLRPMWTALVVAVFLVTACGTPAGDALERAWLGDDPNAAEDLDGVVATDTVCGAQECGFGELSMAICHWVTLPLQPGETLPRQREVPCAPGDER